MEVTADGPSSRFHDNDAVAIDVYVAKQRDVKYPKEADAEDYSECHERARRQSATYTHLKLENVQSYRTYRHADPRLSPVLTLTICFDLLTSTGLNF